MHELFGLGSGTDWSAYRTEVWITHSGCLGKTVKWNCCTMPVIARNKQHSRQQLFFLGEQRHSLRISYVIFKRIRGVRSQAAFAVFHPVSCDLTAKADTQTENINIA